MPAPSQGPPGLILVVHPKIPSDEAHGPEAPRSTSLRQSRETFEAAAKRLFHHRSIADVVRRTSTAVFNVRNATWDGGPDGPSVGKSAAKTTVSCAARVLS